MRGGGRVDRREVVPSTYKAPAWGREEGLREILTTKGKKHSEEGDNSARQECNDQAPDNGEVANL